MTDLVYLPFKIQVYVSHSGEYSYPPGWVDANCMFANNSKEGGGRNLWPSQERAQQAIGEMCRLSGVIIDTRWYRIVHRDTVSADKNDPYAIEIARILKSAYDSHA